MGPKNDPSNCNRRAFGPGQSTLHATQFSAQHLTPALTSDHREMEDEDTFHAAPGRQLVMATQHHLPYRVLQHLSTQPRFEEEDMVAPARVECFRPRVSFSLRFHARRQENGNTMIVVELCQLQAEAGDVLVACKCEGVAHPGFANVALSNPEFPTNPLTFKFTGNGCRATFRAVCTRQMTANVRVWARGEPPLLGPRTLGLSLEAARNEGLFTDVILKVDGEDMAAHRVVLGARSPVFRSMLQSGFMEDLEGVVDIVNVPAAVFRKFLAYLYRGELQPEDWKGSEVDLLELADRYMVDALKAECERRLVQVGTTGVVSLLETVCQRPAVSSSVRSQVVAVAVANWSDVSVTPEWADFQKRNPILADFVRGGNQARRQSL